MFGVIFVWIKGSVGVARFALGWRCFLEGRVSVAWESHQEAYYKSVRSRKSAKRWVVALILKLWDVAWDLWEHRNGIVHRGEESRIRLQLKQEITEEFGRPLTDFPPHTHKLFRPGLEEVLARSTSRQSSWLTCVQSGRQRQDRLRREGRLGPAQMRRVMAQWLTGTVPTQNNH